jgi:hypothetical protein
MSHPLPQPPAKPPRKRPRFQFTLLGLMIVMFVVAAAAAPGYYMFRGSQSLPESRLVGMLMVLAGPLLLMTIISAALAIVSRGQR